MLNLLKKLNLLDSENNLSITNIAVIIVLVKLATTPTWSLNEAGVLIGVLANYSHKRAVLAGADDESK